MPSQLKKHCTYYEWKKLKKWYQLSFPVFYQLTNYHNQIKKVNIIDNITTIFRPKPGKDKVGLRQLHKRTFVIQNIS